MKRITMVLTVLGLLMTGGCGGRAASPSEPLTCCGYSVELCRQYGIPDDEIRRCWTDGMCGCLEDHE